MHTENQTEIGALVALQVEILHFHPVLANIATTFLLLLLVLWGTSIFRLEDSMNDTLKGYGEDDRDI